MKYLTCFLAGAVLATVLNLGKPIQEYCIPVLVRHGLWM